MTPGSVVGLILWPAVSFAFKLYLSYFDTYSATYGSLGAVIILMLWLYVSGLFLLGAEINSEIEHSAAEHGDRDAKARGEIAPSVAAPRRLPAITPGPRRKEKRPAA